MLYVRKHKEDDVYSYSCEVRSVSEDVSKPIRYTSVRMVAPDSKFTNNQIVDCAINTDTGIAYFTNLDGKIYTLNLNGDPSNTYTLIKASGSNPPLTRAPAATVADLFKPIEQVTKTFLSAFKSA